MGRVNEIDANAKHADDLLRAYVLKQFREEYRPFPEDPRYHRATCDEVRVLEFDSRNGSYGCDTGCEYLRLEATIGCPHGDPVDYEYGEFGDTWMLIEDLEHEEAQGT
jgi:hypothetical protein